MTAFIQYVITGLAVGSIYAIVALGFSLVFKATGVFNFAQGSLMMLGAFVAWTATARWGLPLIPAIVLTLGISAAFGVAIHFVVIRPLMGGTLLTLVMATSAVADRHCAGVDYLGIAAASVSVADPGSRAQRGRCTDLDPRPDRDRDQWCVHGGLRPVLPIHHTRAADARATAENSEAAVLSGVNSTRVFVVTSPWRSMLCVVGGILLRQYLAGEPQPRGHRLARLSSGRGGRSEQHSRCGRRWAADRRDRATQRRVYLDRVSGCGRLHPIVAHAVGTAIGALRGA